MGYIGGAVIGSMPGLLRRTYHPNFASSVWMASKAPGHRIGRSTGLFCMTSYWVLVNLSESNKVESEHAVKFIAGFAAGIVASGTYEQNIDFPRLAASH